MMMIETCLNTAKQGPDSSVLYFWFAPSPSKISIKIPSAEWEFDNQWNFNNLFKGSPTNQ